MELIKNDNKKTEQKELMHMPVKKSTGIKFNNLTLVKGGINPVSILKSVRLDKPIEPQVKSQIAVAKQAVSGRAKNIAVQIARTGVSDIYNYQILKKKKVKLISNGEANIYDETPYRTDFGQMVTDYIKFEIVDDFMAEVDTYQQPSLLTFFDAHAIMSVSQKKNVLMTTVQGRDRTRKEFISGGDYMVSISGLITGKNPNLYPTAEVKSLLRIMNTKDVIPCYSPFLSTFGINGLIILDFELTQRQGFHASQPYRISAVYEPSTAVLVEESRKQLTLREQDIEKAKGWVLLDSILEATQVSKILSSL